MILMWKRLLKGMLWLWAATAMPALPAATEPSHDERVLHDLQKAKPGTVGESFVHYTVPPLSNIKRTPSTYPTDGKLGAPVRIVAAKGELEPASIVLYPFRDCQRVELEISDLTGTNGVIPKTTIDAKIVKVWYQTGAGWYSYFADSKGRELVPELLLNDETLIRVDPDTLDNYLRVDYPPPKGSQYIWITPPQEIHIPFNAQVEPVADAKTLQPFSLKKGEFKQLWFTLEAPRNAEGIYTGTLRLIADGKPQPPIPLEVRVLPFELPDPMTNYDLSRIYYTSIYNYTSLKRYLKENGGDLEAAKRRVLNEYINLKKHNLLYPIVPDDRDLFLLREQLRLYKQAGLRTDTLFLGTPIHPSYAWMTSPEVQGKPIGEMPTPFKTLEHIDRIARLLEEEIGHKNVYFFGWDEPPPRLMRPQRLTWKYAHDKGYKTFTTGHSKHLLYAGYNEDFLNYGGSYSKAKSQAWHEIGARITSYAAPHTGPENPDFTRRTHGFDLYAADCDGTMNYLWNDFTWNDFSKAHHNFRSFSMVYPTRDSCIDTIQWEGFREGIDDVRYATLLKQYAHQAIGTGNTDAVYEGRKALLWLSTQDSKRCDLNALRAEMIHTILKLQQLLR